jgi:hypothetical protein
MRELKNNVVFIDVKYDDIIALQILINAPTTVAVKARAAAQWLPRTCPRRT